MSDSTAQPAVTVIIPCYNQGRYLPQAVESVRRQTWPHVACIVVDDGSDDPTTRAALAHLTETGTRVIHQENRGLAVARNAGVSASDTPLFVPLDADDRLAPDFVAALLPALAQDERIGYAYCAARLFGARRGVWRCPAYDDRRLVLHNLSTATALIRRSAFDKVGGYQPDMTAGYEDWDLWLALRAAGYRGRRVPQALFEYRQYERGASMRDRAAAQHADLVRRMIAHHRALYCELLGLAPDTDAAAIFAELEAAVALDHIRRSHLWRILHPLNANQPRAATPRAALAATQQTRRYRLIQGLKRTALHRWYARRRYGSDAGPPTTLA
jgi:glycosyltransferase involved in cell wall biosynthesis